VPAAQTSLLAAPSASWRKNQVSTMQPSLMPAALTEQQQSVQGQAVSQVRDVRQWFAESSARLLALQGAALL